MKNSKGYLINKYLLSLIITVISYNAFPQKVEHSYFEANREVYFRFSIPRDLINDLSSVVSIDRVRGDSVYAYANETEYKSFLSYNIPCALLPPPGLVQNVPMRNKLAKVNTWDTYPTYGAYVQMMMQYQTMHPDICKIIEAGTTVQGRKILYAKITQNVNVRGSKPQVMYSSSMHGNETTGYLLMLRLIDSLVSTYGSDKRITEMVNKTEIWINPLANPDGTYHLGDSTVSGATRYNANSVDLNRNYPDPSAGLHPDKNGWQPEAIAVMNLEANNNFSLAANFHCGVEVVNYPWDTWQRLHHDDAWYQIISRKFADTVHKYSPSGYMTDLNNGITNGYAWYRITGGRQDYMNYFSRGREVTIELSTIYLMPPSLLPSYWNYLSHSLLDFIDNTYYGIRGIVTDTFDKPVKALVTVDGHDYNNSEIYSDSLTGSYLRMIAPGKYNIIFSAEGYVTKTDSNITVKNDSASILNVQLVSEQKTDVSDFNKSVRQYELYQNYPNPFNPSTVISFSIPAASNVKLMVYNILGQEVKVVENGLRSAGNYSFNFSASDLPSGVYFYRLEAGEFAQVRKMVVLK